jgi:thiol-disulfide isomerase/thioredoxin
VLSTQRLLDQAPAARDRDRVEVILKGASDDRAKAKSLAGFLPSAETREVREQVYREIARLYSQGLAHGANREDLVEKRLLGDGLRTAPTADQLVDSGYVLAEKGLDLELAAQCLELAQKSAIPADEDNAARLAGTLLWYARRYDQALPFLVRASRAVAEESDPGLHIRLATTYAATGHKAEACGVAQRIFLLAPLLPGAQESLRSCVADGQDVAAAIAPLYAKQKTDLLGQRRADHVVPEPLPVDGPNNVSVDLRLGEPGQVTVAVFFSTWCPHCKAELPRINAFSQAALAKWHDKVRVIGIRTSVERETEPYETFLARLQPHFPIYTDPSMSIAFAGFCKAVGIRSALPTVAILDTQGVVRFLLGGGDYKDTARLLDWIVESLVADGKANAKTSPTRK